MLKDRVIPEYTQMYAQKLCKQGYKKKQILYPTCYIHVQASMLKYISDITLKSEKDK